MEKTSKITSYYILLHLKENKPNSKKIRLLGLNVFL